jgi:acetyl esterase/lipase
MKKQTVKTIMLNSPNKSAFFLVVLLSMTATQSIAQRVPEGVRDIQDLEYAKIGAKSLRLDLLLPRTSDKPAPLVVWVHGGAWMGGDKSQCPVRPLVTSGFAVASINYRLSQEAKFPAQIFDCKGAVRWLRAHTKEYGFDPGNIGAWGPSAGGHLVALLGTSGAVKELEGDVGGNLDQSSKVQAVIDFFGPTDFLRMRGHKSNLDHDAPDSPEAKLIGGAVHDNPEKARKADPIQYITKDDPPFLIMHGDQDMIVPVNQSELLYEALKKTGVTVTYEPVKGAGHGFSSVDIFKKVEAFLSKTLKTAFNSRA